MWKLELIEVWEIPQAWLVSPAVFLTISQIIPRMFRVRLKSI
jgi:hypothetical protein